jgi:hypothetical protein
MAWLSNYTTKSRKWRVGSDDRSEAGVTPAGAVSFVPDFSRTSAAASHTSPIPRGALAMRRTSSGPKLPA